MTTLQHTINELYVTEHLSRADTSIHRIDVRAKITVTLVFLICVLSLSYYNISGLIPFFIYPIIISARANISFSRVLKHSLIALPFVIFIGIFNPMVDTRPAFSLGNVVISYGWLSFISIILRGILSVQVAILLILTSGFYNICRGLEKMGMPSVFTTQLLFVYRYIFVLIKELSTVMDAYRSRSFGEKRTNLKFWSKIVGQLMIRTIERANRIHEAMISRGFNGQIRGRKIFHWTVSDTLFLVIWICVFVLLRVFHPVELLTSYLS